MVVRDSIFKNTLGHAPMCGIDIEPIPGATNPFVDTVLFDNIQVLDNSGGLLLEGSQNGLINRITVSNSTIKGNTWGLIWRNPGTGSSYSNNNTITGNKINDIWLPGM
jgi:hypothetical protein